MEDVLKLRFSSLSLGEDDTPIQIPASAYEELSSKWRFLLGGRILNPKAQNMAALIRTMPRVWGLEDRVVGLALSSTTFCFKFKDERDYTYVLEHGPWSFNEWMLVITQWHEDLDLFNVVSMPCWVRVRGVPLQFLTVGTIRRIAATIGEVKEIGYDPEKHLTTDYVRVLVVLDVSQPIRLRRRVHFGCGDHSTTVAFEYERLKKLCFLCGMLDHDKPRCPKQSPSHTKIGQDEEVTEDKAAPQRPSFIFRAFRDSYIVAESQTRGCPAKDRGVVFEMPAIGNMSDEEAKRSDKGHKDDTNHQDHARVKADMPVKFNMGPISSGKWRRRLRRRANGGGRENLAEGEKVRFG